MYHNFYQNKYPYRYLQVIHRSQDISLINSMTSKDGWCKNFDKSSRKCMIYENRPHFCRVDKFSILFKDYQRMGDQFLIACCKQHISSNYGKESYEMKKFKLAISK